MFNLTRVKGYRLLPSHLLPLCSSLKHSTFTFATEITIRFADIDIILLPHSSFLQIQGPGHDP